MRIDGIVCNDFSPQARLAAALAAKLKAKPKMTGPIMSEAQAKQWADSDEAKQSRKDWESMASPKEIAAAKKRDKKFAKQASPAGQAKIQAAADATGKFGKSGVADASSLTKKEQSAMYKAGGSAAYGRFFASDKAYYAWMQANPKIVSGWLTRKR